MQYTREEHENGYRLRCFAVQYRANRNVRKLVNGSVGIVRSTNGS